MLSNAAIALGLGLLCSSALLLGAALGIYARLSQRTIAWIMAFGSGILVSAIAFDIMEEAFEDGGLVASSGGFLLGAIIFTVGTLMLNRGGGKHRKRSRPPAKMTHGPAIALGTAIDGIPESIIIGLMVVQDETIAIATIVAIFISNLPEALSASACMRAEGKPPAAIFRLWLLIAVLSGFFAVVGSTFDGAPAPWLGFVQAIAGGALLAMLADTMVPEAFADSHEAAGMITAAGFVVGFAMSHGFG